MKKLKDAAFWQRVKTDAAYEHLRTMIRTMYEESRYAGTIPELGFKSRTRFDRDGDRTEFDGEYFRRRKLLSASAIMALIYPEEEQYLEELQEISRQHFSDRLVLMQEKRKIHTEQDVFF